MKKIVRVLFGISFIVYLLVLTSYIFLKSGGPWPCSSIFEYIKSSSNLIPLKTIGFYIREIIEGNKRTNPDIPIKNLLGNLILFMPMGIYLPFFIKKTNKTRTFLVFMMVLLFSIEILQLLTRRGIFDIDDIILNMLGALIGFAVWQTKGVQYVLKK
ncbi:MAG: VanZ family protein [Clostridiaceae bacterium]|nr:VanZ family protein [Clostridiaceae bacterium]